jgi:hypothetical protein
LWSLFKSSGLRASGKRGEEQVKLNRWWVEDPEEVFWMEITDRNNLGEDLNAPQRADNHREFWGYSLIQLVDDGDVVFHYHKAGKAIVAWSRASGGVWEDTVLWGARGTTARAAGVRPYLRPGWRHGLEDFKSLELPLTLADLRAREVELNTINEALVTAYGSSVYFPVNFYPGSMRPAQGYLTKVPKAMVAMFPSLLVAAEEALASDQAARHPGSKAIRAKSLAGVFGAEYRREDEDIAVGQRDPAEVDPALIERGLKGHKRTQNRLADLVQGQGLSPRSHRPGEPNFDLAWVADGTVFVVEVKSITSKNEEKQLRLGLGQVLRYQQVISIRHEDQRVIPVLAAERKPNDATWSDLCRQLGVRLVWPETMPSLFT